MASSLNSPKPSIVFFGNERLATGVTTKAPILSALIEAGYPIEAIIVNHDQATSRKKRVLEVEEIAKQHNIPVLFEFSPKLTSPIAILAAYGRIIPKSIINHFKHGIVNIHPSALPKYRGSIPIESVILDGSASTAVSLMQLDVKMDAGGVYAQKDVLLNGRTSKQELADQLGKIGAEMLIKILPDILNEDASPIPQDESAATYTQQFTKADGKLDFTKPAIQLEREIRAYAGWPGSSTAINDKPVIITNATVLDQSGAPGEFFAYNRQLAVYCKEQALQITKLKPAGKKEMNSQDYLRGNPI